MNISMFDILGPVMIGPSSSHTAGAQRIGRAMYMIAGDGIQFVKFYLHGSFHLTLSGHGTDRALVSGILGMESSDPEIKESLQLAKERGIDVSFEGADLGDVHPNTVRIEAVNKNGKRNTLVGSSIGGGNVEIIEINGIPAKFSGKYPAVVITHQDHLGIISRITGILAANEENIVTVLHSRENKGKAATTMIELDTPVSPETKTELSQLEYIHDVVTMEKFI